MHEILSIEVSSSRGICLGISNLVATAHMRRWLVRAALHMEGDVDGIGQVDMELGDRVTVLAAYLLRAAAQMTIAASDGAVGIAASEGLCTGQQGLSACSLYMD